MKAFLSIQLTILSLCIVPLFAGAQNTALPVAATHVVAEADPQGGQTVMYDEGSDTYSVSREARDARVFGVTSVRPALVFSTGSGTIPVVTSGAAYVRVYAGNGAIERGDVLVTSELPGVAMRAGADDEAVFAIAQEAYSANEIGSILAHIGIEEARSVQQMRRDLALQEAAEASGISTGVLGVSFARAGIASVIAIGSLFFVLYSFRSVIAKGVVSIGRNPRARTSIVALSIGNIVFALILCAIGIFIALGVLVLPI